MMRPMLLLTMLAAAAPADAGLSRVERPHPRCAFCWVYERFKVNEVADQSLSHYARVLIALPFPPLLMLRSLNDKHR